MLKMKAIDYDLVRFFVYRNNSFSIRCNNAAIISLFAKECNEKLLNYARYNPNWIAINDAALKDFASMISICDLNGLEYEVL